MTEESSSVNITTEQQCLACKGTGQNQETEYCRTFCGIPFVVFILAMIFGWSFSTGLTITVVGITASFAFRPEKCEVCKGKGKVNLNAKRV
jgi:DnaJ-class molecular chaperone